jgi:nucleoside-diphosphate-sugar epimerase
VRVALLGGTRFVGRAILEELLAAGHELLVIHRGEHEPAGLPEVEHLHVNRRELDRERARLERFDAEALVDVSAMTGADAEAVLAFFDRPLRLLAVSSMDVYRAFGSVWAETVSDPVPLDEHSPTRDEPLPSGNDPRQGWDFDQSRYEKLEVEAAYLRRGGTVCRLPFVYGEHDYQRREEPILSRVREGATRIEIGAGTWLGSRGYVGDLASGIRAALEAPQARGEVLNLCEWPCASMRLWVEQILDAAGWAGGLITVGDAEVAEDLELTTTIAQHLLVSPAKAERLLGWRHGPAAERVARSVRWHLEHPPA